MTLQAAGKRQRSKDTQRLCRPLEELEKHQKSAPVPKPLIRPRTHLLQSDKSLL